MKPAKRVLLYAALSLMPALSLAQAGAAGAPTPMGPVSTAMTSNDSDVLMMEVLAVSNLTEIRTSQLALQRSGNAQIRAFAQTMITEHTAAHTELLALANARGVRLTNQPGPAERLQYNRLASLQGAEFDALYRKIQVDGHQMTLDLIGAHRPIGRDSALLALTARLQPRIAMHLEQARALNP